VSDTVIRRDENISENTRGVAPERRKYVIRWKTFLYIVFREVEESEKDGHVALMGRWRDIYKIFVEKTWTERQDGKQKYREKDDNIKVYLNIYENAD
jgi:hypothetical protein